jgi:hypothetical protein
MNRRRAVSRRGIVGYLLWVLLLAFVFAQVEVQIEGAAGWAAALPTWRIEQHWLLDIAWGGRPLTGYHVWVFSFMALVFHLPVFFASNWDWRHESRVLGGLMVFWIAEDFLWFVLNPAFGIAKFDPANIPWHKHWLLGMPTDYLTFSVAGLLLMIASLWPERSLRSGELS